MTATLFQEWRRCKSFLPFPSLAALSYVLCSTRWLQFYLKTEGVVCPSFLCSCFVIPPVQHEWGFLSLRAGDKAIKGRSLHPHKGWLTRALQITSGKVSRDTPVLPAEVLPRWRRIEHFMILKGCVPAARQTVYTVRESRYLDKTRVQEKYEQTVLGESSKGPLLWCIRMTSASVESNNLHRFSVALPEQKTNRKTSKENINTSPAAGRDTFFDTCNEHRRQTYKSTDWQTDKVLGPHFIFLWLPEFPLSGQHFHDHFFFFDTQYLVRTT